LLQSDTEWLLAFLNMARELQEHRTSIRRLEERLRDMEEAVRLIAQEQRHGRELELAEDRGIQNGPGARLVQRVADAPHPLAHRRPLPEAAQSRTGILPVLGRRDACPTFG
jgi:hypothetical protein